jgi:uncharacterized membrane protein HdeD (DUF308 family)
MLDVLTQKWWAVALRGVLAIVFGIVALVFPGLTLGSLAMVFGAYAFVSGVLTIVAAFGHRGREASWYVVEGTIGIAVGLATLFFPGMAAQALVILIGLWAILMGIFEVIAGFELPISWSWLLAFAGVLSIGFGVVVIAYPGSGALAIAWIIGIYALMFGGSLLAFGIWLRGMRGKLANHTA